MDKERESEVDKREQDGEPLAPRPRMWATFSLLDLAGKGLAVSSTDWVLCKNVEKISISTVGSG